MSRQPVKTFFPQTRLSELAARPGGISRSDAIEGALKSIETMRGEGNATILKSMEEIEVVAYAAKGGQLSEDDMCKILRHADQIVTLAGTFGYVTLDKPHALQKAFIDEQAAQCGYCTAGMIMAAKELLDRTPRPTEKEIREALATNLCRCGTHNRIIRAVLRAAQDPGRTL